MEPDFDFDEALAFYRNQGAPGNQQALVALLREIQDHSGGALPSGTLSELAQALQVRLSFLQAVVKRYPSLRLAEVPHRLELCGGPNCTRRSAAQLARQIESTYAVRSGEACPAGGFCFQITGCMKHCGQGPNLKWDGKLYTGASMDTVRALIEAGK